MVSSIYGLAVWEKRIMGLELYLNCARLMLMPRGGWYLCPLMAYQGTDTESY
jgi:hypothetical protein